MAYQFNTKIPLDDLMKSANVAELLDDEDCKHIGSCAKDGYEADKASRLQWEQRSAEAMKLTLQVVEGKTFPWVGCSNVKFPLVTVAATQFAARAYPALINSADLVNCRVYGPDPEGQKTARGDRIGDHMTWQNVRQDKSWESEHDKGLLIEAIAGCFFKKRVFDPARGHQVTKTVLPKNFVVDYWTRELESSLRYTEVYDLSHNAIRTRELDGRFCVYEYGDDKKVPQTVPQNVDALQIAQDQRQGLTRPPLTYATPYETGEQYCWWDLDGDGYEEPYIVTFDIGTGFVRRIVARFRPSGVKYIGGKVYEITPVGVYTKYPFIPSPDGGFYPLGLGGLLGPINESVNTAINQIFDAGTMSTLGGGFVGRGFKNRGGPFQMRPFEWYPVDAPGDDLHKNILPLPVREPSSVLLQLALYLVGYGERIASANDIQMGENPGQNTPAETTRTLNENGARVYSAIYKRNWRALGEEFCLQYDLNRMHVQQDEDFVQLSTGAGAMVRASDYDGDAIEVVPSADPYVVSDTQAIQQADQIVMMSTQLPGFNRYQTQRNALEARRVPNIDRFLPPPMTQGPNGQPVPAPDYQPPPDPKMLEVQIKQGQLQIDMQNAKTEHIKAIVQLQNSVQESRAKVENLLSQAVLYQSQAKSEQMEPAIKLIYAQIESEGMRQDRLLKMVDLMVSAQSGGEKGADSQSAGSETTVANGMAALGSNADLLSAASRAGSGSAGSMAGGGVSVQ